MENIEVKTEKKRSVYLLVMAVCLIVFVFSIYKIGSKLYGYYIDNKRYVSIRGDIESIDHQEVFERMFDETSATLPEASIGNEPSQTEQTKEAIESIPVVPILYKTINGNPDELSDKGIFREYEALKKINNDLAGWIKMPGFDKPIDYPVVQAQDNDYYLYRDFYQNNSYAGSVFLDHRNHTVFPDRHMIIYAHAMNDKSMFGNLKEFPQKPELYTVNDVIYIDLMNYRMEYRVFSVYYEDETYNYRQVEFGSNESYDVFLQRIKGKSVHDFGIDLNYNDRILTLSTCNNSLGKNIRSIVHAKMTKVIDYNRSVLPNEEIYSQETEQKVVISANVYLSKLELWIETEEKKMRLETIPGFEPIFGEYSVYLPQGDHIITIAAAASDSQADVLIKADGKKYEDSFIFTEDKALISIMVTSRDKQYSRTHYVTLAREIPDEIEYDTEEETGETIIESGQSTQND